MWILGNKKYIWKYLLFLNYYTDCFLLSVALYTICSRYIITIFSNCFCVTSGGVSTRYNTLLSVFLYQSVTKENSYTNITMYRVFLYSTWLCLSHSIHYCTECRHSVDMAVIIRSDRQQNFCTECFQNTRYNIKYAEC
jgi:hypothetical protein